MLKSIQSSRELRRRAQNEIHVPDSLSNNGYYQLAGIIDRFYFVIPQGVTDQERVRKRVVWTELSYRYIAIPNINAIVRIQAHCRCIIFFDTHHGSTTPAINTTDILAFPFPTAEYNDYNVGPGKRFLIIYDEQFTVSGPIGVDWTLSPVTKGFKKNIHIDLKGLLSIYEDVVDGTYNRIISGAFYILTLSNQNVGATGGAHHGGTLKLKYYTED